MRNFLVAFALLCLATGAVEARSLSLRSVKNLFVKHESVLNNWGVFVVSAALIGTCAMKIAGCGGPAVSAPFVSIAPPVSHNQVEHRDSVKRGGLTWDVRTTLCI